MWWTSITGQVEEASHKGPHAKFCIHMTCPESVSPWGQRLVLLGTWRQMGNGYGGAWCFFLQCSQCSWLRQLWLVKNCEYTKNYFMVWTLQNTNSIQIKWNGGGKAYSRASAQGPRESLPATHNLFNWGKDFFFYQQIPIVTNRQTKSRVKRSKNKRACD